MRERVGDVAHEAQNDHQHGQPGDQHEEHVGDRGVARGTDADG
jgi:hypothetical protein